MSTHAEQGQSKADGQLIVFVLPDPGEAGRVVTLLGRHAVIHRRLLGVLLPALSRQI